MEGKRKSFWLSQAAIMQSSCVLHFQSVGSRKQHQLQFTAYTISNVIAMNFTASYHTVLFFFLTACFFVGFEPLWRVIKTRS